jgi:hypothetical protein
MAAMATMVPAMWLQSDVAATHHTIMIFIGVIAVVYVLMAVVVGAIAIRALQAIKEFSASAEQLKAKLLPLLDEGMQLSTTARTLLEDAAPKVKAITANLVKTTDNLIETSNIARSTVSRIDVTVTDANTRTQRQVARVDGMVTAALTTTAELAETIGNGIRVPAQKLAVMATQAKIVAEGLFDKIKGMAGGSRVRGQ